MLIEQLLADGYTFVPISKNIYTCDYTIDHTGRQWQAAPASEETAAG